MDVASLKIAKVFSGGGEVHYVLPHFQREYAWEKSNWQTLLDDALSIYDIYDSENEPEHFLGALVVIKDGMRSGTIPAFKLVDGQQRLTTISLCLCAIGNLVQDNHPPLFRKIRKLLENEDESDLVRFKLVPTTKHGDRDAYISIIGNDGSDISRGASRIGQAYDYIYRQLYIHINNKSIDPEKLFLVFANCMHVVFIDLDQRERPYEIFESLNAKGKPLTQPDLVRNYVAMKLPESKQEDIFTHYWSDIEERLREDRKVSRIGELTAFLRHYLAYRSGVLPNQDHVYARFRDRMEKDFSSSDDIFASEIKTLHRFADYYNRMLRPEYESDDEVAGVLERLIVLESATAYPFILGMYEWLHQGIIERKQFIEALWTLENYLVRRYLSGEQSGYTNKMFPTLEREIDRSKFVESLQYALLRKNYPSDNKIRQALPTLQLYDKRKPQRLILILETINRFLSAGSGGHTVLASEPTIEHIMPQTLNDNWKKSIGTNWEEVYREYLHTLGNLTLVTQDWNSSLSNSAFDIKRERLSKHALKLNSEYFASDINQWDGTSIQQRNAMLTDAILDIWPAFGEPPTVINVSGEKPQSITVLGETHEVKSWREIAFYMAELTADFVDNFDEVAEEMRGFFSREENPRSRQMSNGWWVYLNLSSTNVMNFCTRLASFVGLTEDDWEIRLQENNSLESTH